MTNEDINYVDDRFFDENGRLLPEFRRFNVGAALLGPIWGIGNNTYFPLVILPLIFIPFVRYIIPFLLFWFGIKGNGWSIKNKKWGSPIHFFRVQRNWATVAGIVYIVVILTPIILNLSELNMNMNNFEVPNIINIENTAERKMLFQKSYSSLNSAISVAVVTEGSLDMSNSANMASSLSKQLALATVADDTITDALGIKYSFKCNGKECLVYVDVNGSEGPNEMTKSADSLRDTAMFKIVEKQNGGYVVLRPKWLVELN